MSRLERGHHGEGQVALAFFRFQIERFGLLLLEDAPLDFVDPVFAEHVFARRVGIPKVNFDPRVPLERQLAFRFGRRGVFGFCGRPCRFNLVVSPRQT